MLIFRNIDHDSVEGEWVEREIWGAKVRFQIRPRTQALVEKIRSRYKRRINGQDVYDDQKILDEMNDYVFQSFDGIYEELPGGGSKLMEVNLVNKKKILYMDVPFGQVSNAVWIFDRANQAGFDVQDEEQKN
jgi:hypothetical protein